MAELVKVALDAMGGDNAPAEIVKGAVEALNENDKLKVYTVGDENAIHQYAANHIFELGFFL